MTSAVWVLATAEPKELVQYGALGVFCLALITAVGFLSRENGKLHRQARADQRKAHDERKDHAVALEALRAEYEERHAQLADDYAQKAQEAEDRYSKLAQSYVAELRLDRDANRVHEDGVRREFCELMEHVTAENAKSSQATIAVMEKFYHRFIGPRGR